MAEYLYVDNSNVYIEGQRVSTVAKGMAMSQITQVCLHTVGSERAAITSL